MQSGAGRRMGLIGPRLARSAAVEPELGNRLFFSSVLEGKPFVLGQLARVCSY